jgi:hypothetical protein
MVGRRRRGITEGRRPSELGAFPSSSWSISTCDSRLEDMGRESRVRGTALPFTAGFRTEGLPSRLPGRKAREEPLKAFRGCRGVSRPSRNALDWLVRFAEGVEGVELEKGFGGVVEVLFLRLVGLRLRP